MLQPNVDPKKRSNMHTPLSELLFCYEKKGFFFTCYEDAEGRKTSYFAFWEKTFLLGKQKKKKNLLLEKITKVFVISPKKKLELSLFKKFDLT